MLYEPLSLCICSTKLSRCPFFRYFGETPQRFLSAAAGAAATAPPRCSCVAVKGRTYPVDVFYTHEDEDDHLDAILNTVVQIHLGLQGEEGKEGGGGKEKGRRSEEEEEETGEEATKRGKGDDILVFLTGQDDIESVASLLRERRALLPAGALDLVVCPLYAALPPEKQMKAFRPTPPRARKVVLSTNIAETSVTIPGIRYVVDSGLAKVRTFEPSSGIEQLRVVPISQVS